MPGKKPLPFAFAILLFATLAGPLSASPIALKELDLMVRMHTPDAEILGDLSKRGLLLPLDDTAAKTLTADGATPALLDKIKNGNFALTPEAAAEVQKRAAQQRALVASERAKDEEAYQAMQKRLSAKPPSDKMALFFAGKLVHVEHEHLKPLAPDALKDIRFFALYFEALGNPQSQEFTPKLVDFYKKAKADHPEFEIIFVSEDRDAKGMGACMLRDRMPWPAVSFDKIDETFRQYAVKGIPWLLVLDDSGAAIYPKNPNLAEPFPTEWSDPGVTASVLDVLLQKQTQK